MKKILKIFILSLFLLSSCAKPTVLDVRLPGDEKLNCKQLEFAVAESHKIKREAEFAKQGTGGNVARMIVFWPAWAQTLHNADVAIMAANDRIYYLINLMEKKNCTNIDIVNAKIIKKENPSSNNIAEQLKELKRMYDSGDLTKEEYKKAKEKVLN